MGHGPVKEDPAVERFNQMREEAYLKFRWTRRTVRTAVLGFIIVPGTLYFLASRYNTRYDWVGRRRGEPLTVGAKSD
ncbi:hypothetical protein BDN72DRAFT_894717 [Pluteus cervinus]|uniref:Uncharacterized protein n=1 Tax=Pluteus cervinus TaxID=181527 RepID=A0ACD3B4K3_9AGAR|nr:hypothetical protein BDN72DRAFT_894717 [Pluteus cervinus]